jgi:squalene-hopene/tetraprenyl-beta-curcumene cyclase
MTKHTALGIGTAACLLVFLIVAVTHAQEGASQWDRKAAAAAMDNRLSWWEAWPSAARDHETFCVSCHTALPYGLARSTLRGALHESGPSPAEQKLIDNVTKRVRMWREVEPFYPDQRNGLPKTSESRGAESILNAVILAGRDATAGVLSDDARTAFANMWALQMRNGDLSGAWAWLNFKYEPWEAPGSPYFGAALAAVAVGTAPGGYASSAGIQDNLRLLKTYFTKQFDQQNLFNRLMVLWASTKVEGLITTEQRDSIVADAIASQNADGGWSTASLGHFQRVDGTPLETGTDGYATGLTTFVLEQAAGPATRPHVQRGLQWLTAHQEKQTGRWLASSLNKKRDPRSDPGEFMNDAATAFAVLALTASSPSN